MHMVEIINYHHFCSIDENILSKLDELCLNWLNSWVLSYDEELASKVNSITLEFSFYDEHCNRG